MIALAHLVAAGPVMPAMLSAAAAALAVAIRDARRRVALNAALHELRRPLQALVLRESTEGPVGMAAAALTRLEREINGQPVSVARAPVLARPLAEAALRRWRERASGAGATLELRWDAGGAVIDADRQGISEALDNLIDNAIEHGGPRIAVEAARFADVLSLAVVDAGAVARPAAEPSADLFARISGRRRHGHGLRRVRRTAAAHGGRFDLHRGESGTTAVLELPLAGEERRR
jgi:signal transduction histidine kinase